MLTLCRGLDSRRSLRRWVGGCWRIGCVRDLVGRAAQLSNSLERGLPSLLVGSGARGAVGLRWEYA